MAAGRVQNDNLGEIYADSDSEAGLDGFHPQEYERLDMSPSNMGIFDVLNREDDRLSMKFSLKLDPEKNAPLPGIEPWCSLSDQSIL
jgi:hypothetical protein